MGWETRTVANNFSDNVKVQATREGLAAERRNALRALLVVIIFGSTAALFALFSQAPPESRSFASGLLLGILALTAAIAIHHLRTVKLNRFDAFFNDAELALKSSNSTMLLDQKTDLERRAAGREELQVALVVWLLDFQRQLELLLDKEAKRARSARIAQLCAEADAVVKAAIRQRHEAHPQVRARIELEHGVQQLRQMIALTEKQYDEAIGKRWLKLNLRWDKRQTLAKIRASLTPLEIALENVKSAQSLIEAETEYQRIRRNVDLRLSEAKRAASEAIPDSHAAAYDAEYALRAGALAAAVSAPISVAADIARAGAIYDALRKVNGNFTGMSDLEVWHETLSMPTEALVGLASLTKGAYFEKLVEHQFGGERFANFNHPDTDITIDGVAYQIKATDSEAYVNSVANHIPVISTTEVAEKTGAMDGGFTDADLSDAIDLAIGGSIIDFGDTMLDGITTGFGGLGVVAILKGTHSAWTEYSLNGDAANALGVGLKTTAVSTGKSFVTVAEAAYRSIETIVTSPPVKSIGGKLRATTISAQSLRVSR